MDDERHEATREFLDALARMAVGADYEDVKAVLLPIGLTSRLTKKDGQPCICTRDLRRDRLGCETQDGRVVAARWG